ncbi:MAG: hypothetical protein HXX08_05660 [Chloroflexi bacterium]|uniref:Uncharacterized protein n=1 Tax=Candidatus Chlorohelix allophototropha TaxID=3003348 RepID=A0A8T7M0C1_9CHLR|nr:hypothetical protein [Chloroflexota bacterium]WJW67222.1 hypothetical protein OZ401_000480 [Chloroflexota bacterium L227-S17]
MIRIDLAGIFALIVLALVATFGYYRGFMALITRRALLTDTHILKGLPALALALVYFAGAIVVSGVAILFYLSN